jgi:hypothetical protein
MSRRTILGSSLLVVLALFAAGCTTEPVGGNNPAQTGPTITITSPVEGFVSGDGSVTVSGTSADSDGVLGTYLKVDSFTFSNIGTTTFNKILTLAPGAHVLKIYAFDGQANSSATNTRNVSVVIAGPDDTPPVITITKPSQAITVSSSGSFRVYGTVTDDKSGVEGIYLDVNSAGFVKIGTTVFDTNLTLPDGTTNSLKLFAQDISNNCTATNIYTVIIDSSYISPNWDFETWPEPYWPGTYPQNWTNGIMTNGVWWAVSFTSVGQSAPDAGYGGTGYAVVLEENSGIPWMWNKSELAVTTGDYIVIRFYAKMTIGTPKVATYAAFYSGTNQTGYIGRQWGATITLDDTWKEIKSVYQIGAGTNYVFMGIEGYYSTGTFLADNVTFGKVSDLDAGNPSVTITSPANNFSTGVGMVDVTGTSSDDIAVKTVYTAIGSVTNSTTVNTANWSIALDASSIAPNTYQLLAWSEDYTGKKSSVASQNITLTNVPFPTVNLVQYDFEGETSIPNYSNPNTSNSSMESSDGTVTYPAGISPTPLDSISENGWPLDTSWGNYFIFKVIPTNYSINLKNFIFSLSRSSTGPLNYQVEVNGMFVPGASGTVLETWKTITNDLSALSNLSYIVVKICANSATSTFGTFRIDNVTLSGVITTNNIVSDSSNPNIAITAPADNYTNLVGTLVNVTGTSSDDWGVDKVYAVLGTVTNTLSAGLANWVTSFDTSLFSAGDYTLSTWALDYAGKISTLATHSITLTNPPGIPEVTLIQYILDGEINRASYTNSGTSNSIITNIGGTVSYPAGISPTTLDSISANGWPLDSSWTDYFIFNVYPISGLLDLTYLSFNGYRSTTGPKNYKIVVNGVDVSGASGTVPTSAGWFSNTFSIATNLPYAQIQIFANSASNISGTFRIDNVTLKGKLIP